MRVLSENQTYAGKIRGQIVQMCVWPLEATGNRITMYVQLHGPGLSSTNQVLC